MNNNDFTHTVIADHDINKQNNPIYSSTEICLHKQCPRCNGLGVDKQTRQVCIHWISCPCRSCSPWY